MLFLISYLSYEKSQFLKGDAKFSFNITPKQSHYLYHIMLSILLEIDFMMSWPYWFYLNKKIVSFCLNIKSYFLFLRFQFSGFSTSPAIEQCSNISYKSLITNENLTKLRPQNEALLVLLK